MKKQDFLLVVLSLGALVGNARAQSQHYTLLAESSFTDDCLICGRPTIQVPLRGTFTVVPEESNPLFTMYRLEDIAWVGGWGTNVQYDIRGSGTYTVGGEVAVTKRMVLNVTVNGNSLVFTNDGWPTLRGFSDYVIDTRLTQTQQNVIVYIIDLLATPLREVWFSTPRQITGAGAAFGPGHLLSNTGRIVKRNSDLVGRLGFMPVVPHLGIDAVEIVPGGGVWLSLNERQFSETLGEINDGDVLSPEGQIVRKYYDLMGAFFRPIPPTFPPDPGLDALHSTEENILFSVRSNFFSTALGSNVTHGDLLTDRGQIFRSNAQLLQKFQPQTSKDYGLDAIYVWPSGEIWFSIEEGFLDQQRGTIRDGDVLSDAGYIALRNQDLVRWFAPGVQEEFGVDALFVVTDLSVAAAPRITSISRALRVRWEGAGRVFQLERAASVTGLYLPITPIMPDTEWTESLTGNSPASGFYRLRQW